MPRTTKQVENNSIIDELIEIRSDPYTEDGNELFPWIMYAKDTTYSLYIYCTLLDPIYYTRLFEIIRGLTDKEQLNVHINSPGGSLMTSFAFINVLNECKAKKYMYIDGYAESAAAILAFVGDNLVIGEHSNIMFHNIQTFFTSANSHDNGHLKASIESILNIYKSMLLKYCGNILSKTDIKNIIEHGAEIYFTGSELKTRLEKST